VKKCNIYFIAGMTCIISGGLMQLFIHESSLWSAGIILYVIALAEKQGA